MIVLFTRVIFSLFRRRGGGGGGGGMGGRAGARHLLIGILWHRVTTCQLTTHRHTHKKLKLDTHTHQTKTATTTHTHTQNKNKKTHIHTHRHTHTHTYHTFPSSIRKPHIYSLTFWLVCKYNCECCCVALAPIN